MSRERALVLARQLAARVTSRRAQRRARRALVFALDGLGLGLIIAAACLVSVALGFLVAGVIALGVAVVASPADDAQAAGVDGEATEGAIET